MDINSANLRKIMGEFVTGVCVIAVGNDKSSPIGITINSFTSVSIDPPLVLFCMKTEAESFKKIMSLANFSINILNAVQSDLAMQCVVRGGHLLNENLFDFSDLGTPMLSEAIASIECEHYATHPGGDHTIIIAKVISLKQCNQKDPLIFHRSKFVQQ